MADELDIKLVQLEIAQLRKEIERLDKQKSPRAVFVGSCRTRPLD